MMPQRLPAEPVPVQKPEGGYRFVSVTQLAMAWFAYKSGRIQFRDLRSYFALHEMDARRCECDSERLPSFTVAELQRLVGGAGGSGLRGSLGRLEASGLVSWSESAIRFSASPDVMSGELTPLWNLLAQIKNNRRRVPVPRRTVRLIAQCGRPVVVATVLAYLLRCVYLRQGGIVSHGTCKASWVASAFDVGVRNVKAARKFLTELGWLTPEETPQWHKQRYGGRAVVNLAWERPRSYADRETESAPPAGEISTVSTPPDSDKELSSRSKNQKPARGADRRAGFSSEKGEEPSLRDVKVEDLRNTGRLLTLFEQAVGEGLSGGSDYDRLAFVMLAEHALVKGTRNPPGLFMHLLKNKLFHFGTNDDEDAAQDRLKRHFYGAAREPKQREKPRLRQAPRVQLSEDARFVVALQQVVANRRIRVEPLALLRREKPEWTRERWDKAVEELENARIERLNRYSEGDGGYV